MKKAVQYLFTALVFASSAVTVGSFAGVEEIQDFRDEAWGRAQDVYASATGFIPTPDRTMQDVRELAASDADHIIREAVPWLDKLNRETLAALRWESSFEAAMELQDDFERWQEDSIRLLDRRREEIRAQACYEDVDRTYFGDEAHREYERLLFAAVERSGVITRADLTADTGGVAGGSTVAGTIRINSSVSGASECAPDSVRGGV